MPLFCFSNAPGIFADTRLTNLDNLKITDPEGISYLKQTASRSPSGILYKPPYQAEHNPDPTWNFSGILEFGALFQDGDEKAGGFNHFQDWNDSPLINFFEIDLQHKKQGYFFKGYGSGIGRDNHDYGISFGKQAVFKITGHIRQTPTRFSSRANTLFDGAGSDYLSLPEPLQAGQNTQQQLQDNIALSRSLNLSIERQQSGINIEFSALQNIKLFADFKHQKRRGSRPFGGSFFPPFYAFGNAGGVVESIEPINYTDNEITLGAAFNNDSMQWNVSYHGAFFVNELSQLSFENPFSNLPGSPFIVEQARIALPPDNQFHQFQTDWAIQLPLAGHLSSTFSWSRMRQDETLIPPTINSGFNFSGINLDQWNTVEALDQQTAKAEIDHLLFQINGQFSPFRKATLRSRFRYEDEDNKTDYRAFNPSTGQYGYITVDGAADGALFTPQSSQLPIRYRNIPFAARTWQWLISGDYRLFRATRLNVEYQHRNKRFRKRERKKIAEDTYKIALRSRSLAWATVRISYQFADRNGDDYDYNPYSEFNSTALTGYIPVLPEGSTPHTLAELRKFDISDRRQHQIATQSNFLINEHIDLLVAAKWQRNDHDSQYGLMEAESTSANLELNYQPAAKFNANAFYSFQRQTHQLANINDAGFSADPHAGGETFPLDAAWKQKSRDIHHFAGIGIRFLYDRLEIDSRYSYSWSENRLKYQSNNPFTTPQSEYFPAIEFDRHIMETNFRWHMHKHLSLRLMHRYEQSQTRDWHYQDLQTLTGNHLFLNVKPEDYAVHLFGLFLQVRL